MPRYSDGTPVLARHAPQVHGMGDNVGPSPLPANTNYADEVAAQQAQMQRQAPGKDKSITNELLQAVRRFNITAGPPAHIRPSIWSTPVDKSASVVLGTAVTPYTPIISYVVPKGYGLRIEQYSVNVLDPAFTYDGSILWAFTVGAAFLGDGMSNWGEQRGNMVFPSKTAIIAQQGQQVQFLMRRAVAAGAPQTVQMGFRGWVWRMRNNYEGTQMSVTAY